MSSFEAFQAQRAEDDVRRQLPDAAAFDDLLRGGVERGWTHDAQRALLALLSSAWTAGRRERVIREARETEAWKGLARQLAGRLEDGWSAQQLDYARHAMALAWVRGVRAGGGDA